MIELATPVEAMMSTYSFETPLGIQVTHLSITRDPLHATLTFTHDKIVYEMRFQDPRPLAALTGAFDDCNQIRVVDHNSEGVQLDFGRYQVELWDEDNDYATFVVDSFEQIPIESAPGA